MPTDRDLLGLPCPSPARRTTEVIRGDAPGNDAPPVSPLLPGEHAPRRGRPRSRRRPVPSSTIGPPRAATPRPAATLDPSRSVTQPPKSDG